MRKITMLLGLATAMTLGGCPEQEVVEPEPEPVVDPEPEPEPEPAPAPAMDAAMDVAGLNADRANHVGKEVSVAGMFGGSAEEGEMVHVTVLSSADEGAASLLCAMKDGAAFASVEDKSEITVKGTVSDKDMEGKAILDNCAMADKPMEGDGAEMKPEGDGAEGAEGAEGEEAGAEGEGGDGH